MSKTMTLFPYPTFPSMNLWYPIEAIGKKLRALAREAGIDC